MSELAADVLVPLSTPDEVACRLGRWTRGRRSVHAPRRRVTVDPSAEVLANGT